MENQITVYDINAIAKMADAISRSGLFGISKPDQAVALMLIAQAEGMHPAIAARDYHIIQGRPALKADAMLARFQSAGGKVEWIKYDDMACEARFSHPAGGSVVIKWDMERVKRAGLDNKDNYKKFPRQMLRARTISEGIRTVYPGITVGVYTPEETRDFEDEKPQSKAAPVDTQAHVETLATEVKQGAREVFEGLRDKATKAGVLAQFNKLVDAFIGADKSLDELNEGELFNLVAYIQQHRKTA